MPPEVSVIIAAYNAAATLRLAIESALAQEGVKVEIIVVDDASSDATAEAAEGMGDDRIKVVRQPANNGPGPARNVGLDLATGEWVAVLDADDAFRPNRIASLLARARRAGADFVVDNLDVTRDLSMPGEPMFAGKRLASLPALDLETFIRSNMLFKSTYTFGYLKPVSRRAFIERHGLRYRQLRIGEDYLFLAEGLALGGSCCIEPLPGYRYRVGHASMSRHLTRAEIGDMRDAEVEFGRRYRLEGAVLHAFHDRLASLDQGHAFLGVVENIKGRHFSSAIALAMRNPRAMRHLWMPIAARARRMAGPFR